MYSHCWEELLKFTWGSCVSCIVLTNGPVCTQLTVYSHTDLCAPRQLCIPRAQPLWSFQQFPAGHLGLAHLITAGEAVSQLLKRANARLLFKVAKLLRMQVFQVGECGFCKSLSSLKTSFWEQMPKKKFSLQN